MVWTEESYKERAASSRFYFFVLFEPPHPVLDTDGNDTTNTLMTFFVRWRKYRGGEEDERIEGRGEKRMLLLMLMLYY